MPSSEAPPARRKPASHEAVAAVRAALAAGVETQAEIARRLDLSPMTVSRIAKRDGASSARTTSAVPVQFRASVDEIAAFDAAWSRHGAAKSRSEALRRVVRSAAGMFDADAATLDEWRDLARQLRGVATNINQMARTANRGDLVWSDFEKARMDELAAGVGKLSRRISTAVSVGARKARAADLGIGHAP